MNIGVSLGSLRLANPVIAASGTFGFGPEYAQYVDIRRLGGIAVKGVSPDPWPGNPPPRVWETPAGLLNSIGLQNPGVEVFCRDDLPFLRGLEVPTIVNIIGKTTKEYAAVARRLDREAGIAALEVNISCPNVKEGGIGFGQAPGPAAEVTAAVRAATKLPIIVKLSPNVGNPVEIAQAVAEAGADMLSAINTVVGMAIDIDRRRPALGGITGGLSGPAIKPIALRMVYEVAQAVSIPVIGIGGITNTDDVIEFLMAGAQAVMVGTVTFQFPERMTTIIDELPRRLEALGIGDMGELVGAAWPNRRKLS